MPKKPLAVVAVTVVVLAFGAAPAYADTASVGGELNRGGSLVQYNQQRTHAFDGPISMNITDMPGSYLRLGLRNMKKPGGPQFGDSLQWNSPGGQSWDGVKKGTKFALQGRMGKCHFFCDNTWAGTLTF